ncbi:MAG: cytochrome C [Chloroflexi bacterium]|nr:MAG: cytochrome C [Chloroflexota bacterium]
MTLASGEKVPLHVDPLVVENSVHGLHQIEDHQYTPLLCTDCHTDQARYGFPHQPVTPPDARQFTLEMSNLCRQCHEDIFERQMDSTHARALSEGKLEAAMCSDCHGSHNIQPPNQPRERISRTCAQCHAKINEEYKNSVHGAALLGEDNPDVPVCIDCHGVHNIADPTTALFRVRSPKLCAGCHADEELMAKYSISTNVFDTYVADFHGTTVELFEKQSPDQETNKAVCYDCHGVHNILPPTDENSQVIRENLVETCRKCHPDATPNFADAWTSHYEPSLEHYPVIYLVNLFYRILIPATIGGFMVFIASDVYRRYIRRR